MRQAQAGSPCLDARAIALAETGSQTSAKSHFWARSGEALRKASSAARTCSMTLQQRTRTQRIELCRTRKLQQHEAWLPARSPLHHATVKCVCHLHELIQELCWGAWGSLHTK